jgi:hypothetical protein
MSELVRSAMEMMTEQSKTDFESDVTQRLQQLESAVHNLDRAVAQILAESAA